MSTPLFQIGLSRRAWRGPTAPEKQYDPELDNIVSIINDACELVAGDATLRFEVAGFGQAPWPVDVMTDLAVVIEQLPEAIGKLEAGKPFKLDFFEQGIERCVTAVPDDRSVRLTCRSMTTWQPSPLTIEMSKPALLRMLVDLLSAFLSLLDGALPWARSHPWVRAWLRPSQS